MASASKKQTTQTKPAGIKPNQSRQASTRTRPTTVVEWGNSEIID